MKLLFQRGDIKEYLKTVTFADIATFDSGTVHEVYATFSIARDAEWSGRLFVLDMKEEFEEGIGTYISVEHIGPAFVGDTVRFVACLESVNPKGEVVNTYQAFVGDRLIAEGRQVQRILPRTKIEQRLADMKQPAKN